MKTIKILQLLVVICLLSIPVMAQTATKDQPKAPEPQKIILAPEEAKSLKQAFDEAKTTSDAAAMAQEKANARNAEAKALYFQLVIKYKVDLDKFNVLLDEAGLPVWIEKPEERKQEAHK